MLSKFDKYVNLIKDTKDEKDYSIYTQIIKNERIKRNQTLESMAKGICSISYLSKMENNTIKPSEEYVKALLERVDVNYDEIIDDDYDLEVKKVIKYYFYNENDKIREVYLKNKKNHFDARLELIGSLVDLIDNRFNDFKEKISEIDEVKNALKGINSVFLVYLVSEYYIKNYEFKKSYYYLKCLDELNIDNYEMKRLIDESLLYIGVILKKYPLVYKKYQEIRNNEILGYPTIRKNKNKLLVSYIETEEFNKEYLQLDFIDIESIVNKNEMILYIVLLIFIKKHDYYKALNFINENNIIDNKSLLSLYGLIAYYLNDEKLKEKFLKCLDEYELDEVCIYDYFLKFLKMKFDSDDSYQLFEYLRYLVIPYLNDHDDYILSDILKKKYVEMLIKLSRYKEATLFLCEYQNN